MKVLIIQLVPRQPTDLNFQMLGNFPQRIEIPPFPGGKRITVTNSFDDGVLQDRRVVESFNEWGLKGTFNLNSGFLGRPRNIPAAEVAQLYAGHAEVWYCTNMELFDYEAARQRLAIAANRATAFNPSALPVTLNVDGRLVDVLPGQVARLAAT